MFSPDGLNTPFMFFVAIGVVDVILIVLVNKWNDFPFLTIS
jgi:hypothetical protein